MRFRLFAVFLLIIWFTSCGDKKNSFTLNGNIDNMPAQVVILEELGISDVIILDSVKTEPDGKFTITGSTGENKLFRLRFSSDKSKFILLSFDKGAIGITGNWNNLAETYNFTGSPSSSSLRSLIFTYRQHIKDYNTLCVIADTMEAKKNDSLLVKAKDQLQEINQHFTRYCETYSDTCQYLPNALCAVQLLNPAVEKDYINLFNQSLVKRFPNSKLAHDFDGKVKNMSQSKNQEEENGIAVGTIAPEINLQTLEGKSITLSSFRGKYVLVDFWASWCPPCRAENPNVVAAYNLFKNKKFTIYAVSLDEKKDKWLEAIQKDGLTWTQVSDFQRWQSLPVRNYGVNAIPANFLLDPSGKIIAKNLHGGELEAKLSEVLK